MNYGNITSAELFGMIDEALHATDQATRSRLLHETLQLTVEAGLRGTTHSFGNLASRVDRLCRKLRLNKQMQRHVHRLRVHSHAAEASSDSDFHSDLRTLAMLIAAVFSTPIPAHLHATLPPLTTEVSEEKPATVPHLRCIVNSWTDITIHAQAIGETLSGDITILIVHEKLFTDYAYLPTLLREGMQIALLDAQVVEDKLVPRLIVVEPDYLLDTSALAACFEDYGHHPLSYTVRRMAGPVLSTPILIGNLAGEVLNETINHRPTPLNTIIRKNFEQHVLDFCACPEFNAQTFKTEAERQSANIAAIVDDIFATYDRSLALLEPTFISEAIGLRGRIDLMTSDMQLLVEQKSGRNTYIEHNNHNRHGSRHIEKHYVQLLLYSAMLHYNFGSHPDIFLLYSKYPMPDGLLEVQPLQMLTAEAIKLRNEIVATEYRIATDGFDKIIDQLTPDTLNTEGICDKFFVRYQLPQIDSITAPLHALTPLERQYFCRMMTFIVKEEIIQRTGSLGANGSSTADLWSMPLAEKRETGNIFTHLTIVEKAESRPDNGIDVVTVSVPDQGDGFLPNFRQGDAVYLYAYDDGDNPDVRRSILHRAVIAALWPDRITLRLNNGQQNPASLDDTRLYAIEHAERGTSSGFFSLHQLASATKRRRDLLLCQRPPVADKSLTISRSYHPHYDEVVLKARQACDFFLISGPPGTGKTSLAMRFIVEEELATGTDYFGQPSSVLLAAYTNRAVDEICQMLDNAGIDFVRIGNEYATDSRYRQYLAEKVLGGCRSLADAKAVMSSKRVVVGTTSSLVAHPWLFGIKHFALAIIDEASQLLEPAVVGLLCSHQSGTDDIDRFILIGDHKQLPAVVAQTAEESAVSDDSLHAIGLQDCRESLFERLLRMEHARGTDAQVAILHRHGRMHPDIARWPNSKFYLREQLVAVPLPHQQEDIIAPLLPDSDAMDTALARQRTLFIASPMPDNCGQSTKVNLPEAQLVADIAHRIYDRYGETFQPERTLGIIVPYRNQISAIRKALAACHIAALDHISIDTVERYQGSQREVIIYSLTVSRRSQLDFLTANTFVEDGQLIDRKLNVALTRARRQLILVGNREVLSLDPLLRDFIDEYAIDEFLPQNP